MAGHLPAFIMQEDAHQTAEKVLRYAAKIRHISRFALFGLPISMHIRKKSSSSDKNVDKPSARPVIL
jgi:hypothetical protein